MGLSFAAWLVQELYVYRSRSFIRSIREIRVRLRLIPYLCATRRNLRNFAYFCDFVSLYGISTSL